MKKGRSQLCAMIIGILLGAIFCAESGVGASGSKGVIATPAQINILVDNRKAEIEAYAINGSTYVRLVDVGKEADFNVYWDGAAMAVRVESQNPYTGAPTPGQKTVTADPVCMEIIELTNRERERRGENPLEINEKLMQAAQVRAEELAATTTYAHIRPDGRKFNTVTDCPYLGENIHRISDVYLQYYHCELAEKAVEDWIDSPRHQKNLLSPDHGSIGVGIAKGKNDSGESAWYCVQLFLIRGGKINWVDEPILN